LCRQKILIPSPPPPHSQLESKTFYLPRFTGFFLPQAINRYNSIWSSFGFYPFIMRITNYHYELSDLIMEYALYTMDIEDYCCHEFCFRVNAGFLEQEDRQYNSRIVGSPGPMEVFNLEEEFKENRLPRILHYLFYTDETHRDPWLCVGQLVNGWFFLCRATPQCGDFKCCGTATSQVELATNFRDLLFYALRDDERGRFFDFQNAVLLTPKSKKRKRRKHSIMFIQKRKNDYV